MKAKISSEVLDSLRITKIEGQEEVADYANFSIIPSIILRSDKISPTEKLVFSLLFTFNHSGKPFFGSNEFIAASIGKSVKTIQKTLASLEKYGLLQREYSRGDSNLGRTKISIVDMVSMGNDGYFRNEVGPYLKNRVAPPQKQGGTPPQERGHTNIQYTKKDTSYAKTKISENNHQYLLVQKLWNQRNPRAQVRSMRSLQNNLDYQLEEYGLENILLAIRKRGRCSEFFQDINLTVLLRKKNRQGEPANYIQAILDTPILPEMEDDMKKEVKQFLAENRENV